MTEFWAWCHKLCVKHSVDVLMGDFSMALFRVTPELRSRGSTIDVAAWYPWKSSVGEPCADSCAIFCLQKPGLYKLEVGLQNLHADDEDGILALCTFGWESVETAVAGKGKAKNLFRLTSTTAREVQASPCIVTYARPTACQEIALF